MANSRRSFLKYCAVVPLGMSFNSMSGLEGRYLNLGRTNATKSSDTIVLSISFIGPLASIVDGDDVTIYAPRLDKHVASAETSANEIPLEGEADYDLSGLPTATGE